MKRLEKSFFDKPEVWIPTFFLGGYLLFRGVKKLVTKEGAVDEAKKDEKKLVAKGVKPTYTEGQYMLFADRIYTAGIDAFFGTDEDAIYSVFGNMKNDLDVNKLIQAFGERRIEFSMRKATLGAFLSSELDSEEMNKINNILSTKGIKYRF